MKSEYVLIHAAPIKHYGIKGQKKGVRRFQLDNGQLTAAGKVRYYNSKDFYDDHYEKNKNGGRPYTTPYDYESPEEKAQRAMKNAKMAPMLASYDRFNKAYSKIGGAGHVAMEKATKAAGVNGRALVGAYGKNVGKTRSSAPSVPAVDSKTPWGKRASAVASTPASTPATKKETKDNLGQNGGRPYSTPYTQTVASGRKKNVTGSTTGASKNDKLTLEEKAPAATVGAKTQGAILKAHNAVRVTTQNGSSGSSNKSTPTKESSNSYDGRKLKEKNAYDESRDAKKKAVKNNMAVATEHLMVDTARSAINAASTTAKPKSNVIKDLDNGAVDTLKKKDLVKIKSGKNTKR
jgi:hypothetical protein